MVMALAQAERISVKGEDEWVVKGRMLAAMVTRSASALGSRTFLFVNCMGVDFTLECGQSMLDCATLGSAPWECIGGITCSGKSAFQCVKMAG